MNHGLLEEWAVVYIPLPKSAAPFAIKPFRSKQMLCPPESFKIRERLRIPQTSHCG
jgi:hypothetical protein